MAVIRALLKWLLRLGLLLVALIVALVVFKDELLRRLVQRQIRLQTGLQAQIDRLHVGFTEPVFTMRGFQLQNRAGFGGGTLVHIPELHVEYYPDALRSGRLRLKVLKLDLAELNLVRNADGETNLVDFVQQAANEGRKALQRRGAPPKVGFAGVDTLHLSLGTVRYVDLANPARNRTAYFGIRDMEIKNIRDEDDLYGVAALVLLRSGVIGLGAPAPTSAPGSSWLSLSDMLQWLRSRLPPPAPLRFPSNHVSEVPE
jgi:uncharacterized protein involved in outer membrane biogenesis